MQFKKLWIALGLVMAASFAVLGGVGYKGIKSAPPIPTQVVTDGRPRPVQRQVTSRMDKTSGSRSAARKSARSGAMAPMLRPTGSADYLHREVDVHARRLGAADRRGRAMQRLNAESARGLASPIAGGDAPQHLRRRQRHDHCLAGTRSGL